MLRPDDLPVLFPLQRMGALAAPGVLGVGAGIMTVFLHEMR